MKTATAIAGMLAAAAIGAGIAGWWARSPALPDATAAASRATATGSEAAAAARASWRVDASLPLEPEAAAAAVAGVDVAGVARAVPADNPARRPVVEGNPLDSPEARMRGQALYLQMNCAGCHGYHGEGNMGPPLADPYWLYGGTPAAVYRSIALGRRKGMPAWGQALPPESLWQLVAYLQSLGGTVPPGDAERERHGDFPVRDAAPTAGPDP